MKIKLLLCGVFMMFLVGCNAKQPAGPNVYQGGGCPTFTMSEDFKHVGSPEVTIDTYCVRNCRPFMNDDRVRSSFDVYVATTEGNVPEEVCLFERDVFKNPRVYWAPVEGEKVTYDDRIFAEGFGYYKLGSESMLSFIERHLDSLGYTSAGPGYSLYVVKRNVAKHIRLSIVYAYNYDMLPADIKGDDDKVKAFLRERFSERVANL